MTLSDIAKYRLVSQQILTTKLKSAAEMVGWFGAVQAQEYAPTKWGLGLRLPNLKDADLEHDFTNGKILRTHLLRPTWHFVAHEDIRWMLALTAPRVNAVNGYMYRQLELDSSTFNLCNDILIKVLQGNKQLTRDALNQEFKRNNINAEGHRLSYIMMRAELDAIICSGARQGNQFTYALLEERVTPSKEKNHDEALAELTKRYFTSRGPATIKDFSTWSGLTLTDCKKGIEMTKSHFTQDAIGKDQYYFRSDISLNNIPFPQIYLLPIYDEYIMGYKNREAIFQFRNNLSPKQAVQFDNTIIFEGQVIGTWKRTIKPKSIQIEYDLFKPLSKGQSIEFENTILRLGEFTGMEIKSSLL